jgi:putative transposase
MCQLKGLLEEIWKKRMNNPLLPHHRKSIRLRDYNYSQNGLYFVTICVNKKLNLFGGVEGIMVGLSDAGQMVDDFWNKLPEKFREVFLDEYVIMPNHFHGIIGIDNERFDDEGRHTGLPLQKDQNVGVDPCVNPIEGLPRYLRWFKTMTTNKYIEGVNGNNWEPFYRKLWQRNYFEHVIRNEKELSEIRKYIEINPLKWDDDEYNSFNDIKK